MDKEEFHWVFGVLQDWFLAKLHSSRWRFFNVKLLSSSRRKPPDD
jgi:hypothetical protein